MLRTALLSIVLIVSLSSGSTLKKSISRRQSDAQYCQAIEGFDCKCSYYRVTCTNDRDLPSQLNILQNELHKYQSVELVITAPRDINVNDRTFEPVKELFKPDADNLDFRIKFEKFTALQLSSPGIFNRVFPDNLPANARKHLALEIYNPDVPPQDNPGLFKNLQADSLELYALYPFHGSFQQLFDGANIKYLRLSGGEIRSDVNQPFTGNVARLELAKQASELSVQNFPVYPAHEMIINAFYINDFNAEYPPNYNNLGELRVYSPQRIPANAFKNFPNLHTLQISTDQDIDPQALNGLNKLDKLIIKDTKPSLELLNSVPNVKEFETNIEKLDEKTQCQLVDKLANGQLAVQSIPNGRECTCISAYLDTAVGRLPCEAQHCEHSSCAAIKNNYDASTRTFKTPPAIRRADGSDALRQRDAKVYNSPYQIAYQDQEKLQRGLPPPPQPQPQPQPIDDQRPVSSGGDQDNYQPEDRIEQENPSYNNEDYGTNDNDNDNDNSQATPNSPWNNERDDTIDTTPHSDFDGQQQQGGQDQEGTDSGYGNQGEGDNTGNQGEGGDNNNNQGGVIDGGLDGGAAGNGTETGIPPKKGMSWLPIIIIAAAIVGILLIGLIILIIRKKRAGGTTAKGEYRSAATNEPGAART